MAKENYIDINALPKSLLKEENKRLIKLMLEGDFDARQKLIESNMRLVTYRVSTRFGTVNYDKEELVSIGNLGLIKAVDTFDSKREISLATYAIKCIDNEIYMFLRKLKKVQADISLSQPVNIGQKDTERHIEDFLSDGLDIEEEYLNAETILRVRELVKKLPPALRETVNLYYGFNDGKRYTQEEIAKKANCLQPTIHKRLKKAEKLIKRELEKQERETRNYLTPASTKAVTTSKKAITANQEFKLPKKITRNKTFYEILNEFSKEQIDKAIASLSDEENKIVLLRYAGDLNNPPIGKLTEAQRKKFYGYIVHKIRNRLSAQDVATQNAQQLPKPVKPSTEEVEELTKEDYQKVLELIKNKDFAHIIHGFESKEIMMIILLLGYINSKSYSISTIAKFLEISESEAISAGKSALEKFKQRINQIMEGEDFSTQGAISPTEKDSGDSPFHM